VQTALRDCRGHHRERGVLRGAIDWKLDMMPQTVRTGRRTGPPNDRRQHQQAAFSRSISRAMETFMTFDAHLKPGERACLAFERPFHSRIAATKQAPSIASAWRTASDKVPRSTARPERCSKRSTGALGGAHTGTSCRSRSPIPDRTGHSPSMTASDPGAFEEKRISDTSVMPAASCWLFVWVWAIASTRRSCMRAQARHGCFEQAFWSGQSIEELYRSLSASRRNRWRLLRRAMREWKGRRKPGTLFRRASNAHRKGHDVSMRGKSSGWNAAAGAGDGRFGGPVRRLFGTVWGSHVELPVDRGSKNTSLAVVAPGIARRCLPRQSALSLHSATIFYNKFTSEVNRQPSGWKGSRRIFSDPVAPDRRTGVRLRYVMSAS